MIRSPLPRSTSRTFVTAMLVVAGLAAPAAAQAQAPAVPEASSSAASHDIPVAGGISGQAATALAETLGDARTSGVYLDRNTQRMVVAVTDDATAKAVTNAGGIATKVAYSTAHLESITSELDGLTIPGTGYGVDVTANEVVVDVDSTVAEADVAKIKSITDRYGDAARVVRGTSKLVPMINGGDMINPRAIADPYGNCSLGFNVRKKNNPSSLYMITAGHCTVQTLNRSLDWERSGGEYIGYTAGGFFPENDFGLIRHYNANVDKPGNVDIGGGYVQDITHSRDPGEGETVCSSGMMSKFQCGRVLSKNYTANYSAGKVYGLVKTDICTQGGDSGGPLIHGDAALGLLSGGPSSGCAYSIYQQLNEALAWYDVEVY